MALVKISSKHQVVIPKEIFQNLGLAPGDLVEVSQHRNQVVIRPKQVVDPEDAWFYSPKTQALLKEALAEVKAGRVSPKLRTKKELQDYLDKLKK